MSSRRPEKLSVALCQMTSTDSLESNLSQMLGQLEQIKKSQSVQLVCFPENSLYFRIRSGDQFMGFSGEEPFFEKFSEWACEEEAYLHLGSFPWKTEQGVLNRSLIVQPDGELVPGYSKIHLFDVEVQGEKSVRESDYFLHGEELETFNCFGWSIGQSICYDLRFAEVFVEYAKRGVDAILVPSAFLVPTGRAHWEVLLRARAIETQSYVLAAAQGGIHTGHQGGERETYGHSLAIGPWGEKLGESQGSESLVFVDLQRDDLKKVREQIPMSHHRRLD